MEEAGELAEKIGLLTGATGKRKEVPADIKEQIMEEAIDVMQAAYGVVCAMELLGINPEEFMDRHVRKMKTRGYLE